MGKNSKEFRQKQNLKKVSTVVLSFLKGSLLIRLNQILPLVSTLLPYWRVLPLTSQNALAYKKPNSWLLGNFRNSD